MRLVRNTNGFTLLEILIAALILSVGFLGMAGIATSVMRGDATSSRLTVGTNLAHEKMEEIRGLGFSGMPNTDWTITEGYHAINGHPLFKRVVTGKTTYAADGLKMVTVTVYWEADTHKVILKTLVGR